MAETTFDFTINTDEGELKLKLDYVGQYISTFAPAIDIVTEDGELYQELTSAVEGAFLYDIEHDIIVDHNVNDKIIDALIDAGFLEEDPYTQVSSGFVRMKVFALNDKGYEWLDNQMDDEDDR